MVVGRRDRLMKSGLRVLAGGLQTLIETWSKLGDRSFTNLRRSSSKRVTLCATLSSPDRDLRRNDVQQTFLSPALKTTHSLPSSIHIRGAATPLPMDTPSRHLSANSANRY